MKRVVIVTAFYLWLSLVREKCKLQRYYLLILGTFSCLLLQLAQSACSEWLWDDLTSETYCSVPREVLFKIFYWFLFFCTEYPGSQMYVLVESLCSEVRDIRKVRMQRGFVQSFNHISASCEIFSGFIKIIFIGIWIFNGFIENQYF